MEKDIKIWVKTEVVNILKYKHNEMLHKNQQIFFLSMLISQLCLTLHNKNVLALMEVLLAM